MLSFLFISSILAAAHTASDVPYEDDVHYVVNHNASEMTDIEEVLFVLRQSRNLLLEPRTPCQAMVKLNTSWGPYGAQYQMFYTAPGLVSTILNFTTNLSTSTSPPHDGENVVTYQTLSGGAHYPFKVMYASSASGCCITVFPHKQLGRACRLYLTNSTVRGPVPRNCWMVYRENCPRDDMQIFMPFCYMQVMQAAL